MPLGAFQVGERADVAAGMGFLSGVFGQTGVDERREVPGHQRIRGLMWLLTVSTDMWEMKRRSSLCGGGRRPEFRSSTDALGR